MLRDRVHLLGVGGCRRSLLVAPSLSDDGRLPREASYGGDAYSFYVAGNSAECTADSGHYFFRDDVP